MIILGLLLLAAAAVGAVELIMANGSTITVHMWRWSWQVDAFWLAVAGAAILLVALMGLGMLNASSRRSRRVRRERKDLRAENSRLAERADFAEAKHVAPTGSHVRSQTPATAARTETQPAPNGYVTPDGQDAADEHAGQRG